MCDHHADCIDLDGKYDCRCHIGYAGNGFECINIDECLTNTFLCPSNSGKTRNTDAVLLCQINSDVFILKMPF